MAKVKVKGTTLKQTIAMTLTDVAQLTSVSVTGNENETVDSDTLDNSNAGIPYASTGRTEGGSVDFEGLYDPGLAGHQAISDLLTTPADVVWNIVWADATVHAFTSAGVGFDVDAQQGALLSCSGSLKVDGLATWPT